MPRAKPRQSVSTAPPELLDDLVVEEQPTLEARLSRLNRAQLQALVQALAARQPNLVELIDEQLHVSGVAYGVLELAEQARPYIETGDGNSALTVLEAVTDEYVTGWTDLDDSDGEADALFGDLSALWAEAILTADLTPAEREAWASRLADWHTKPRSTASTLPSKPAQVAAVQGWDDPELLRMLRGDAAASESETVWIESDLAIARLNVLERQGRLEEALHLADATRQVDRYVALLVRLDRLAEARRYGLEQLTQAHDALILAQVLLEHGAIQDALQIAEHGLSLAGELWTLASWLRDEAATAGETDRATRAALVALRELHSLADYQALRTVAGARWPTFRDEVLAELRQAAAHSPSGVGAIFVYEGLLDDASVVADGERCVHV